MPNPKYKNTLDLSMQRLNKRNNINAHLDIVNEQRKHVIKRLEARILVIEHELTAPDLTEDKRSALNDELSRIQSELEENKAALGI